MSRLLNKFRICDTIDETIKSKIKLFHVFNDNMLFVTIDDTVYGLGRNSRGCLGLGHDMDVKTPLIIPELCGQRIQQFINGRDFVLAINEDNHVFSWGHNEMGQLGRDVTPEGVYLKPEKISYLNDKNISHICCGFTHSLALTIGGQVYGWGRNYYGQVGCGDRVRKRVDSPVLINFENNYQMKSIYCFDCTSFAITVGGMVFSWGYNSYHQLGDNNLLAYWSPVLIPDLNSIQSIANSNANINIFIGFLSHTNDVYFCGQYMDTANKICKQATPLKMPLNLNVQQFSGLYSHVESNPLIILNDSKVCKIISPHKLREYSYNNFVDYYANELNISYNTLHVNANDITVSVESGQGLMDQSSYAVSHETDNSNEAETTSASTHTIPLDSNIVADSDDTNPQLNQSLNTISHDAVTTGALTREITPDNVSYASTGSISSLREKFEKLAQNSKFEK